MAKPWIHAESSARKFGGVPEDYIDIHDFMDSSKEVFPDNRHRALTHNSWFIFVCERVFGHNIQVGNKNVSVPDVCEQHILEDYGNKFIPTAQDYLEHMEFQDWMNNAVKGVPSSHKKIEDKPKNVKRMAFKID